MSAALPKTRSADAGRFTDDLRFRCPPSLTVAIDRAATRNMMSVSEYVRRSVIDKLRDDGIDPVQPTAA